MPRQLFYHFLPQRQAGRRLFSVALVFLFLFDCIGSRAVADADDFSLPAPGQMVHLSPGFNPPILKGLKVHPDNPLQFDFIIDQGDAPGVMAPQATKLVKYFLAGLTVPEKDLWVNLSPYEKDRIIPSSFGLTEMGRDLLAEDYILKQITASLIYPEDKTGKKFWEKVYKEAYQKYGTTNIPVNTFNKVWIVPQKAVVYENAQAGTAYVVEAKLKVMLEEDYLSLQKHSSVLPLATRHDSASIGTNIIREIVIPELTKEVNEGHHFAQLRQVYNSLILAEWYKRKIKNSILEDVYADKNKVKGVGYQGRNIESIYQRYLKAFKKGVYNYIKEDNIPCSLGPGPCGPIARKYFSGGMDLAMDATDDGDFQISHRKPLLSKLPKKLWQMAVKLMVYNLNDKKDAIKAKIVMASLLGTIWLSGDTAPRKFDLPSAQYQIVSYHDMSPNIVQDVWKSIQINDRPQTAGILELRGRFRDHIGNNLTQNQADIDVNFQLGTQIVERINQIPAIGIEWSPEELSKLESYKSEIGTLKRYYKNLWPDKNANKLVNYMIGVVPGLYSGGVPIGKFRPLGNYAIRLKMSAKEKEINLLIHEFPKNRKGMAALDNLTLAIYDQGQPSPDQINQAVEAFPNADQPSVSLLMAAFVRDSMEFHELNEKERQYVADQITKLPPQSLIMFTQGTMDSLNIKSVKETLDRKNIRVDTLTPPASSRHLIVGPSGDQAMRAATLSQKDISPKDGGIDLSLLSKQWQAHVQGPAIAFHLDPAMLQQLQNAPGFVPVIVKSRPVADIQKFLEER